MSDLVALNPSGMAQQQLRQSSEQSSILRNRTMLDQLRSGVRGTDDAATRQALRGAAKEFEAVFMNQLVSAMRKTVGESELIKKSQGEKMFEGMLDEQWARGLAGRHGPSGLSEMIYRQLGRQMGLDVDADANTLPPTGASPLPVAAHPLLTLPAAPLPAGLNAEDK